jgi:A/G-specific adenine glycosylase
VIEWFQKTIYSYYQNYGRDFPFRREITPYYVLISEIMLQQTQTGTVTDKYQKFLELFPDFYSLSKAPLEKILSVWKGLGYNRRAVALKRIAEIIINEYDGKLPESIEILNSFPQIGPNTAASIYTFAFNKPVVFIETNIRRVFIYFFFPGKENIRDKDILPLIEKTIDPANPRLWYYALMDYGVMLKKNHPELNKRSAHYRKQAPFIGSNRSLRGEILKLLIELKSIEEIKFTKKLKFKREKIANALNQLEKEGFIKRDGKNIVIAD